MHILLPTIPSFLQLTFPRVRRSLSGVGIVTPDLLREREMSVGSRKAYSGPIKALFRMGLIAIMVLSLAVGVSIIGPALYYQIFPADVVTLIPQEAGTAFGGSFEEPTAGFEQVDAYIPPVDTSLPEGNWLVIPRIGVRTELQATDNPEEALQTGVWQVPEFGEPGSREMPMILAAHRYGWQWWWQTDYWKYNSFYLLPDTEPGDRIEVISEQRKWIYEIYAGEEGEDITDYAADLILYTCKYLQSPVRHFRYARLIDPTTNTQVSLQ